MREKSRRNRIRLGIISDVHADLFALKDALERIDRLGCDSVVCTGDLIDYGVFPEETIGLIRERKIPCVRGNHDRWAVGHGGAHDPYGQGKGKPYDASGWDLSPVAIEFLAALPMKWDAILGEVRVAVRHGTPNSDMDGIYPDLAEPEQMRRWLKEVAADVLIVGHTHLPFVLSTSEGLIVNPGALLRQPPQDQGLAAFLFDPAQGTFVRAPAPGGGTFGTLDLPSRRFTVYRAEDGHEVKIPRVTF